MGGRSCFITSGAFRDTLLDRREQDGYRNCATCKVPMGNSKSLLATVVVENIEHKCNFEDCEEMVHFKEYKNHQRRCVNRNVNCPGTDCNKLLSFREVVAHTKICPEMNTKDTGPAGVSFRCS